MSVKDDIQAIIADQPGGSSREIADCLGRDPRNTRRDIAELRDRGVITAQKDEAGIDRYYLGDGQHDVQHEVHNLPAYVRPVSARQIRSNGSITDLVPVRQSNGQVILQIPDGRSRKLRRVPTQWLEMPLSQPFDDGHDVGRDDPGDNDWWNPPPTGIAPVAPKEPSKAVVATPARPPEPSLGEICQALLMASTRLPLLNGENSREAVGERRHLEEQNAMLLKELQRLKVETQRPVDVTNELEPSNDPVEAEDDIEPDEDDEQVVPFVPFQKARQKERHQAASDDYSDEGGFVVNGDGTIKPTMPRAHFDDILAYEAHKYAEEVKRRERLAPQRTARVAEMFARKKAASVEEPPRTKTWGEKFAHWLTKPAGPPVWR